MKKKAKKKHLLALVFATLTASPFAFAHQIDHNNHVHHEHKPALVKSAAKHLQRGTTASKTINK